MKNLATILIPLAISALLVFMSACEYDKPVIAEIEGEVSFSEDIIPYFNASCNYAGCHNTGGVSPDLTPENAYADLFDKNQIDLDNPEQSSLYTKIAPGGSMANYSTPNETAMVLAWIEAGAENN